MDLFEHKAIAELYASESATRFGKAMFQLVQTRMAHQMLFVAFLPIKFELPCMVSGEQFKAVCDRYIQTLNKDDIWLKRSPVGPSIRWVRHSDYTPLWMLKRSRFYRDVLKPMNGEHGASIVAWHGNDWLATLTIVKNSQQGDFTEEEMRKLESWQVHFESVARRLAFAKEGQLDDESLSTFIWDLPTSALILDWDMVPRHFNASAVELCNVWQYGVSAFRKKVSHQRIRVPQEISAAIPALKPQIVAAKLARPGPLRRVEFQTLHHSTIQGLSAKVYFMPSKGLSLTRGRFLIQFHYLRQASDSPVLLTDLSNLSRPEREVALHAARGMTNQQIGKLLRKSAGTVKIQLSQVFKKLNLKSRVELANVVSSNNGSSSNGASNN
jgi:DNA-binding CsgD family transcriptional regulator